MVFHIMMRENLPINRGMPDHNRVIRVLISYHQKVWFLLKKFSAEILYDDGDLKIS